MAERYTGTIASHKGDKDGIYAALREAALDIRRELEDKMKKRMAELAPPTEEAL